MKLLHSKEPIKKSFECSIWFLITGIVFSLKMKHVPKHIAEAYLMFVLNKNVHVVGVMYEVGWYF